MADDHTLHAKIIAVQHFHEVFGIGNGNSPTADLDEDDFMLRYNLMREENEEYLDACRNGDLVEIADALGDMMYILFGTICKHGLQQQMADVFDEIHRSNMSKLGADGKPIYLEDGKVLKGEGYFRPDIRAILGR